jgi:hypothetical protein
MTNLIDLLYKLKNHLVVEGKLNSNLSFNETISNFDVIESSIILLSLAPHIVPNFYEDLIHEILPQGGDFPEFGGVRGTNHRGLLPTGETIQYILGGHNLELRLKIAQYFSKENRFYKDGILDLESIKDGEPIMSGRVILSKEWVHYFVHGEFPLQEFNSDFPARYTTTDMEWNDVVLHPYTADLIEDIRRWVSYNHKVLSDIKFSAKIKPGLKALFYGPPGTGKTLTATLLGNEFGMPVYKIDLSLIVSKYIGETEKNLSKIFDRAKSKNWILFFDEADALFGKRSSVNSSNDRYANQEVSYLLQRIEDFDGLVILASNLKSNIDTAFMRRFQTIVHFPAPNIEERKQLWVKAMPETLSYATDVDTRQLATKYEFTGAEIINVVRYAYLKSIGESLNCIHLIYIMEGIRKELQKEGKYISSKNENG